MSGWIRVGKEFILSLVMMNSPQAPVLLSVVPLKLTSTFEYCGLTEKHPHQGAYRAEA